MQTLTSDGYPVQIREIRTPKDWTATIKAVGSLGWEALLTYKPKWPGQNNDDIRSVQNKIPIRSRRGQNTVRVEHPTDECSRVSVPKSKFDVSPPITRSYKTTEHAINFFCKGWGDGITGYNWLSERIERHRMDRWSDEIYGIGKSRAQRMIHEYDSTHEISNASVTELIDTFDFLGKDKAEQIHIE